MKQQPTVDKALPPACYLCKNYRDGFCEIRRFDEKVPESAIRHEVIDEDGEKKQELCEHWKRRRWKENMERKNTTSFLGAT